jgi:hypothetical protein
MKDTQALLIYCVPRFNTMLSGNNLNDRKMLYDFIVDELSQVEEQHHRVAEYVCHSNIRRSIYWLSVTRRIHHSRKLLRTIKSPSMRSG